MSIQVGHNKSTVNPFERENNVILKEHGLDILLVHNYAEFKLASIMAYDVLIVDGYDQQRALELLKKIRASVHEEVYLKPCFLLTFDKEPRPECAALVDGLLSELSISDHLFSIEKIAKAIEEIKGVTSNFKGRKVLLKLIRYLYSRDGELSPVVSKHSHMGYTFPFLEANVHNEDYQEVLDLLNLGVERGYFHTEFVDTLHLCSNCMSGFINYREVCPKCDSRELTYQNTIHHFVCGNVGPEKDYVFKDRLKCPKCDRLLRHIGVDYDKPSLIVECSKEHVFQEPKQETYCFNCNETNEVESLVDYAVLNYRLTASGADLATSGRLKKTQELKEFEGFVSLNIFKTFLNVEQERQKLSGKTSVVSFLNLMLSPKTLKNHMEDMESFTGELARLLRAQLHPTEIVTFQNDEVFLIISPEIEAHAAADRFKKISDNLINMIRTNLDGDEQDTIVSGSFSIDEASEDTSIFAMINEKLNIF